MRNIKRELPNRSAYAVADALKRSSGLTVGELAGRLGMSYMGVKAQCLALEKSGHVTSRNQHQQSGRPRLVYRLTARGQNLFLHDDHGLAISVLNEARTLFGAAAAGKLLFLHFQKLAAAYLKEIPANASPDVRLAALAAVRDAAGHMARVEGGCLVEAHVPLAAVFEAFPAAVAMEEAAISKALGTAVTRRAESSGDHYQIRFEAFRG